MVSSGTYNYQMDGGDIAAEVWERLGKATESMQGFHFRSLRRTVNLMFSDWANRGVNLWAVDNYTQTCISGSSTVTLNVGSIDILEATLAVSGVEAELTGISRDEYAVLPIKTQSGRPTQFWVNRSLPLPVAYLYPVPDGAFTYVMSIWRMRQLQDFSAGSETPDVPYLWYEALCAGASARMAVKFAPTIVQMLDGKAETAFMRAAAENTEKVPLQITIDPQRSTM